MSGDIILTRPSTRLHAPPGGKSSISFGSSSTSSSTVHVQTLIPPIPAATLISSASSSKDVGPATLEPVTVKLPFKVIIVAALKDDTSSEILSILTIALARVGIQAPQVTQTQDAMNIPYIVQALQGQYDGILAVGLVKSDVMKITFMTNV